MKTVNREYVSSTFAMYFSERKNLLSLYNAVNGTDYDDTAALEMNTLQGEDGVSDSVFSRIANDLSFIFHSTMSLYEHQSTLNWNMPLRMLFYVCQLLRKRINGKELYRERKILIPTPVFVVFYNGRKDMPDKLVMKLSEQMMVQVDEPGLELTVTAYNINAGHNRELMEKCRPLYEYAFFIASVRQNIEGKKTDAEKTAAIEAAIDSCIRDDIMKDFLTEHREAVIRVNLVEYNEQDEREGILLDGIEQGMELGIEQISDLNAWLVKQGRTDELFLSFNDRELQQKLLQEMKEAEP